MDIVELHPERPPVTRRFDFQSLSDVLFESADLLEQAKASKDPEFRTAAIELAVRSLYTASAAIDRYLVGAGARRQPAERAPGAAIVAGPWNAALQVP